MRDAVLRAQKDKWMAPLAQYYFRQVHPNVLSGIALTVGLVAAWLAMEERYALGLLMWFLNRILDGLDGLVARTHAKQSDFGGYLDLLLDFIVYLAVPLGFVAANPSLPVLWSALALLASYVLNLLSWTTLSALLEKRERRKSPRLTSVEMPAGLIEGAETILFYSFFFLMPQAITYLFGLMALLVLVTAGQRVVWAYRHL
ncbi:MAG: membrane protein [Litorilinea sp.]|nr:MAG: membrane protein [Litorilinea sp.]